MFNIKEETNIMRKLFSKLMSTTLSAAMLITLGAGTVGNMLHQQQKMIRQQTYQE